MGQLFIDSAIFNAQGGNGQSGGVSTGRTNGLSAPEGDSTGDRHQLGSKATSPSRSELGTGGTGGSGMDGGNGGNGAIGGVGGAGAGGAGGTIRLVGSVIKAESLVVDTSGGLGGLGIGGQPNAGRGGDGRFLYGANIINGVSTANPVTPASWNILARSQEFYAGPRGINPFVNGSPSTPLIPGLQGGADAYGLLQFSVNTLFSAEFMQAVPADSVAAIVRVDAPPQGLAADFEGYDLLLVANLSDEFAIENPSWSAGGGSPLRFLAGGMTNNPGFDGNGNQLSRLEAGQVYAMLIGEGTQDFSLQASINIWEFAAELPTLDDGQVTFLGVERAGQPLAANKPADADGEYLYVAHPQLTSVEVLTPDVDASFTAVTALPGVAGSTTIELTADQRFVYVTQAADNSLIVLERNGDSYTTAQTLREGVDGAKGLVGVNGIALSPDESYLYVTAGSGHSLSAYWRDANSGVLEFVQQLRNGNSTSLGLYAPNSVVVEPASGLVIVGSSDGVGQNTGGLSTFSGAFESQLQLNDGFTLSFDGPLGSELRQLAIQTGTQADRVAQINAASVLTTLIRTGDGDDLIDLQTVTGQTWVFSGTGQDLVELRSVAANTNTIVETGDDADNITLRRTGPNTTTQLLAGAGEDLIQIAGHQLQSAVSVDGGMPSEVPQGDRLLVESGGEQTNHDASNQSVQVEGFATIQYADIELLNIIAPAKILIEEPEPIIEGGTLRLDASGTDTFNRPASFAWDLNADGQFGEYSGELLNLTWSELTQLNLDDDGVYRVALRVTTQDEDLNQDFISEGFVEVAIVNAAPSLVLNELTPAVFGEAFEIELSAIDAGRDTIRTWQVDWGDGTLDTYGSGATTARHVYQAVGAFEIQVMARDEDNPQPNPAYASSRSVQVRARVNSSTSLTIQEGQGVTHPAIVPPGTAALYEVAYPYDPASFVPNASLSAPHFTWNDLQALGIDDNGQFTLGVRARVDGIASSVGTLRLTVTNVAPSGVLSSDPTTAQEGSNVSIFVNQQFDPSTTDLNAGLRYSYDFDNDGNFELVDADGALAMFTVTQAGTQVVRTRIADKDGGFRDIFTSITTTEVAPTLSASGTGAANEGSEYALSLSSTDPGADRLVRWMVDWGDGQSEDVVIEPEAEATDVVLKHTYADDGSYEVRVSAVDQDGAYDLPQPHLVQVANIAPQLTLAASENNLEGSPVALTLASTDPGDDSILSWTIEWGDGTQQTIAGSLKNASHTYADDGSYRIRVTAIDEDSTAGLPYAAEDLVLLVEDVAPTAKLSGPSAILEGSVYELTIAPAMDPGADPIIDFVIDWGDQSSSPGLSAGTASHVYQGAGPRTIALSLREQLEDGSTRLWTNVATLNIEVGDLPPVVELSGNPSVPNRQAFELTVGEVSDPGDPGANIQTELFLFRWGDGTSDTYTNQQLLSLGRRVQHTYPDDITSYTIGVDLLTDQGEFLDAGRLTVKVLNLAPLANDDQAFVWEDGSVSIPVLENDTDGNQDPLTITAIPQPSQGSARLGADGRIVYTPRPDFAGSDEFSYVISDGRGEVSSATVQVTIGAINDAPVINSLGGASTAFLSMPEGQTAVTTVSCYRRRRRYSHLSHRRRRGCEPVRYRQPKR